MLDEVSKSPAMKNEDLPEATPATASLKLKSTQNRATRHYALQLLYTNSLCYLAFGEDCGSGTVEL